MSIVTPPGTWSWSAPRLRAGDGARLVQGEAHDVDVATAGGRGGERDGGIALGVGREFGEGLAEGRDDRRQRDAVGGGFELVEPT
jgi:hypothetical protein